MDNARIGKIEKARRYAQEPDRIQFQAFVVEMRGNNRPHRVEYQDGYFHEDDEFFQTYGYSSHTMALERLLNGMIKPKMRDDLPAAPESAHISKIQKAKEYASQKERVVFKSFEASVRGDNNTYTVHYDNGHFDSDNEFFRTHGYSAHTLTLERVLDGMLEKTPVES